MGLSGVPPASAPQILGSWLTTTQGVIDQRGDIHHELHCLLPHSESTPRSGVKTIQWEIFLVPWWMLDQSSFLQLPRTGDWFCWLIEQAAPILSMLHPWYRSSSLSSLAVFADLIPLFCWSVVYIDCHLHKKFHHPQSPKKSSRARGSVPLDW